jgi:hypothetical protein
MTTLLLCLAIMQSTPHPPVSKPATWTPTKANPALAKDGWEQQYRLQTNDRIFIVLVGKHMGRIKIQFNATDLPNLRHLSVYSDSEQNVAFLTGVRLASSRSGQRRGFTSSEPLPRSYFLPLSMYLLDELLDSYSTGLPRNVIWRLKVARETGPNGVRSIASANPLSGSWIYF